ncbi:amidohydrolase family protein, partial [Acinetobacter baumannii]
VRKLGAQGVDVIKFMATGGVLDPGDIGLEQHFTDAEMKAIIDTAYALHLKVAAHAHGARGIDAAVRAGVDSIEHGTYVDDQGIADMKA